MASSPKDYRFGGKQKHGNSRKAYFARRLSGLASKNKEKRKAKNERHIARCAKKREVWIRYKKRAVVSPDVVSFMYMTVH